MESKADKSEQGPSNALPEAIRHFCHHLVALTWYQGIANEDGEWIGTPKWQAASAFLVELHGICWLATAAHIITEVGKEKRKNPNFITSTARVWDGWNFKPELQQPIPFDFFANDIGCIPAKDFDMGIDLALIPISTYLGNLLSQSTVPFPREHWFGSHTQEYETYYIVGTPTCLAEEFNTTTAKGNKLTNEFRPFIVQIERIDPSEVSPTEYDQFVGRIHPDWQIESIVGMSGGVILGFHRCEDDEVRYKPVAVQSRWIERRRIVIGTYLSPCLEAFEAILREPVAYDKT